ncbi:MAG: choice-of-anchor L domain-containing protein [Actinomycetota bacterium]
MATPTSRLRRPVLATLVTTAVLTGMLIGAPAASAAVLTQSLSTDLTPGQLASALVGPGVSVSNAQFTGADLAAGTFSGGGTGAGATIGFDQGLILSSGAIASVPGPNSSDSTSSGNGQAGDTALDTLLPVGQTSQDAAVLTFDFTAEASSVSFQYVFSSEEYNEFVGSGFNDVFGFFVNGTNCATVSGQPVSVNTVNGGDPFGTGASHPELFRNNDPNDPGPATIDTQMDGLTTVLTCVALVSSSESNTMKLAIGDVGDSSYDSNVFIEAGSLTTDPLDVPGAPTAVAADPGDGSAGVSWTAPDSDGGSAIDGYTVTCTGTTNPDDSHTATVGGTTTSAQVGGLRNGDEYTCSVTAHNAIGDSEPSEPSLPFTPTASDGEFSTTIDTSEGGVLVLQPPAGENLGTTGRIVIPPQPGPATDVVVTASLFGQPGETDDTCGGNVCVGQGIEWAVSNPSAITRMFVKFFERPQLTHGTSVKDAIVYKDGVPLPDCIPFGDPCVRQRKRTSNGGWRITVRVDGSDPKGRI